jgi:hypothetical protein
LRSVPNEKCNRGNQTGQSRRKTEIEVYRKEDIPAFNVAAAEDKTPACGIE